jgi:hypothetical protein
MASAYLHRTNSGTGSTTKSTLSMWVKFCNPTSSQHLWIHYYDNNNFLRLTQESDSCLQIQTDLSNSTDVQKKTTRVFRDTNAWYHIVLAIDLTDSTQEDKYKLYINGERETVFQTNNNTANSSGSYVGGNSSWNPTFGRHPSGSGYFNGLMTHVHFVDGTTYTPSTFGETDTTTGIWKPKTAPSVTYGTNGYFLKMDNSGNMGLDSAGSNNFTTSGTIIQTKDTPSNVYCSLNPLDATSQTLSHINLSGYGVENKASTATLGFDSGKWYWECKCVTQNTYTMIVGITNDSNMQSGTYATQNVGPNANGWSYFMQNNSDNGKSFNNNTLSSVYQTVSQGDILQIAVDADAGKIWWGVNGTYVNSGNPATGANAVYTNVSTDQTIYPAYSVYAGSGGTPLVSFNFGNGYFGTTAITSAGSNGNGSLFEFDVPSGFYALNTKNLGTQS